MRPANGHADVPKNMCMLTVMNSLRTACVAASRIARWQRRRRHFALAFGPPCFLLQSIRQRPRPVAVKRSALENSTTRYLSGAMSRR